MRFLIDGNISPEGKRFNGVKSVFGGEFLSIGLTEVGMDLYTEPLITDRLRISRELKEMCVIETEVPQNLPD
jgi:hypothetical protein